jgi:hypothetical protein
MTAVRAVLLLAGLLGLAACGTTPATFGITGPGTSPPPTFKPPPTPEDSDAAVGIPGLPNTNSVYSPSLKPAGDAATPGSFYGYN